MYLFPFNEVEKGSRVVLYGAGVCGRAYYEQCTGINYCDIVLWADVCWQQLNNVYKQYRIRSIQDIELIKDDFDYVVIAIVDEKIAEEARDIILKQGVSPKKIIHYINVIYNDCNSKKNIQKYIQEERFLKTQLKSVLPPDYIEKVNTYDELKVSSRTKKRIRFAVGALNNIIGFQSVAEAFYKDADYDVLLVVYGNPKGVKAELDKLGISYVYLYDYNIMEDRPDVFFVTYGGNATYQNMKHYAKLVVAIHISIVKWSNVPISQYIKQVETQFNMAQPDIYIWDKLLFDEFKKNNLLKDNFYLIGNPKFDVIYNCIQKKAIRDDWEKIKGKKVFLWCTDHVFYCENISFDVFAKPIISLVSENPDSALIFRPHPQFVEELLGNGVWTFEDLYYFKKYFEQSDNMIWDDSGTYERAYSCCDAILVDSECGIICSALPLGVPMAALIREEKKTSAQQDLVDNLYSVRKIEDLENFVKMVMEGQDPLRDRRMEMVNKYINHFDGMNGKRIKSLVEEMI